MRTLTLTLVLSTLLPASASALTRTVRLDSNGFVYALSSFNINRDARLGAAVRKFGEPDYRRAAYDGQACTVYWRHLGLQVLFVNFGLNDSCDGRYGLAQRLVIKGVNSRQWRTERGLRIGMRESAIPRRHPAAVKHANGWWLTTVTTYIGDCPCRSAGLRARVTYGRVTSLRANLGRAGD